jgi:hypothetical protein
MPLDVLSTERLRRLGVTSPEGWRWWEQLLEEDGRELFDGILDMQERFAADFRERLPELTAFAAECRLATPVPNVADLTPREQAEYDILRDEMACFAAGELCDFIRNKHYAFVVKTTHVGLAAASDVFAGCPLPTVLLTAEEWRRWYDRLPQDTEPYGWYMTGTWTLREGLESDIDVAEKPDFIKWIADQYPLAEGDVYWLVNSGHHWGSLAGGEDCELWTWNGTEANYRGPLYSAQT